MTREKPRKGQTWHHFKDEYYIIICVGHHSETMEEMVVYQKLNKRMFLNKTGISSEGEVCIRPLRMFMSEVDRVKYPNATQKYRFERVEK